MSILHIKKRKEFLKVAKEGFKVITNNVILQAAQNFSEPRVGYTTTKKIGKAHIRNLARRRMRAAVRENAKLFTANADIVLIGRHNTADCSFAELSRNIKLALEKINAHFSGGNHENASDSNR